jgi:DnaJ-class molecular chaperone
MEDYYKILGIQYNASNTDISNSFNLKMIEYKCLPFLTDKDKQIIKNLKKAFFVLSNEEYKKTYDNSLKITNNNLTQTTNNFNNFNQISGVESGNYYSWTSEISSQPIQNNNINQSTNNINQTNNNINYIGTSNTGTGTKKQLFNHSYISDRIFSLNGNSNGNNNVSNSEILRPKNVGLSSDVKIDYDTPIDYN